MDVQEIVGQLLKSAADDPESLKQFGVDPAAAIKGATGLDLTDDEVCDVVKAVEPLLEGKELNLNAVMEVVGDFLGDNPGDLLGKLGGLFSGK
ncbi:MULTISPECIES: homocitrate synthase [Gordonibacter]|uniref:Homocitrate synthase n=1 Tax=Gordonibacter faecis TaxID=3047475 RepID=A0ABT7DPB4_9ACTN|nr:MULTISPECIES: homocitrate synthase [unclassified Gordonibacter]MDJ1651390.1 homocitrate synthase [Gordonibacter sp. KGMB12511]